MTILLETSDNQLLFGVHLIAFPGGHWRVTFGLGPVALSIGVFDEEDE